MAYNMPTAFETASQTKTKYVACSFLKNYQQTGTIINTFWKRKFRKELNMTLFFLVVRAVFELLIKM